MAKMVDPKTYARNVIKSAGYITTATIKGVNPTLTQYVTDTTNSAREMYRSVRDYKSTIRNKVNSVLGETGYEDLKKIKGNIMDDLRTGKFYNPEREEQTSKDLMEKMGFAAFNFDDIDFDVDENVGEKVADETATASSINTLAEKITKTQRSASATSAKSIIKGGRVNTAAMMAHDEKMFGQLNSSLANIHSSVINLHRDLAGPLNAHIMNSANFYGVATNELSKQTAILENIQGMLADRFAPIGPGAGKKPISSNNVWKTIMGGGLPNFSAWGQHAKNRLASNTGLDMLMGLDPEMIQMLLQSGMPSPVAMILSELGANRIRNSAVGKGLNRTLGTLKGGFNHMAVRISQYARKHSGDFTLPALLANLFDIMPSGKAKMDFGNYNKGRQDWTGMDSKALREVIPTQLAQILSAITGRPPKLFDYKTGKFMTSSQIKDEFNRTRNAAIGSSSNELKREILDEFIEQDKRANRGTNTPNLTYNSKAVRNLSKTYDTLVSMLAIKNVNVANFRSANELISFCRRQRWIGNDLANGGRDYIFDEKSLRRLARIIYGGSIPGVQGRFEGAIIGGQMVNADMINNAGDTTYGMLHNGSDLDEEGPVSAVGSAISSILENKDKYGNDVYFYLHSYYESLKTLVDRASAGLGTGNRRTTNTRSRSEGPTSTNTRRERARSRTTHIPSVVSSGAASSSSDDDSISDDERYLYNASSQEYEAPRTAPTSANTRVRREKESIFTKLFNKTNAFLDDLFYGNSDAGIRAKIRDHGGILGMIKDIPQTVADASKALMDKLKEFAKDKWNKFKESDFGKQYFSNMKTSVTNFAKDTWQDAKSKAGSAIGFMTGKVPSWAAQVSGSRRGGVVQRSGMASVSEGEIIIPADQNPNYTGHMGNAARDSIERTNYKKWLASGGNEDDFYGFFRGGTKSWSKLSKKTKERIQEMYNDGKTAEEIAQAVHKPVAQIKDYVKYLNGAGRAGRVVDEAKDTAEKVKDSKAGQYVEKLFKDATGKVDAAISHLFGESDTYSNAKKYAAEAKNVAKENLPKTFADATIGGLIGAAVTGSGLGLIGGMVIGAGTSIIKRSDVISKALFGEEDVEGNYSGGVLPDKVTKFIKKRLPKVAKSAAIGGVLGTLGFAPGGIFGGMAIGAGLELVSTTDTFKDIMFGKPNVHGQRTGGIMGSIRDHVVTPLIDFTRGGLTKIGDYIKENFLKPIGSLFDPIKDWVKGKGMKMMDTIVDATKATVKRTVGERFNALFKPISEKVGAAGKWALGAAGKVASAPFRLAGKMGEGLAAHNIRAGYSSKSAKERMDLEGTKMGVTGKLFGRKLKNTGYTKWASTASDEDIQAAAHYVSGANSLNRSIIGKRQDLADMITASLRNGGNMDPKIVKQIKKLFNTDKVRKENDFSDVIKAVQELPEEVMGSETKEAVLSKIEEYRNSIDSDNKKLKTFDSDQNDFFNRIGLTDAKSRKKFTKEARIQAKLDAAGIRKATGASEAEAIAKAKEKDEAAKLLKDQEKDSPIDAKRNSLLTSILNVASGIARHIGVSDHEIPKDKGGSKVTSGVPGVSVPSMKKTGKSVNEGGEAPEGTIKTEFVDGKPVQFIYRSGQWTENMADSGTKNAVEDAKEDRATRNSFYNAWVGGGILNSLKGLFGSDKDGEKKETLWDKIKGFFGGLFGESGIFGKIFGALGGAGGIGSVLSAILPGILGAGAAGLILNKVGESAAGTSKDSGMNSETDPEARKKEVEGWTGISGFFKKFGLGADAVENTIRGRDTTTYDPDDYVTPYMTDRYTGRMAKNVILGLNPKMANAATKVASNTVGRIPVVGKALSGGLNLSTKASTIATKLGTGIKSGIKNLKNLPNKILDVATDPTKNGKLSQKVAEKVYTAGSNLLDKAGKFAAKAKDVGTKVFSGITDKVPATKKVAGVATDIISKIKGTIKNIFEALISKLGLKSSDEAVEKVASETAEAIAKKGGSKLATFLAKAVIFVQIALIANAVIEGFQDAKAKTILGILDKPTTMQKILAAACNGLNEAIPGIGGIIPTEILFSIMFTALEALGCKFDTLSEQRKQAKATVEAYNKENGTTYNVEEYIHNVLGEYTFQENIAKGVKSGFNTVKNTVSSGFDKFKSFFTGKKDDTGSGSGETTKVAEAKLISMGDVNSNYTRLNGSTSSASGSTSSSSGSYRRGSRTVTNGSPYSASGTHATQKGNYRVFGGSTIDQNGCGPASAATVLRAYGKNVSVNDAATYAESGGYVAGASGVENAKGTKASYFNDILGRNGIKTSYTDDKSKIKAAVSSGNPTILLGQDKNNSSKSNSPFGPNPHYVVTRGTDKNGNVVVDDPELNGTALYKRDILNKAKLGVATAGASGVSGLLSSAFSGFTSKVSEKLGDSAAGKIWNFIFSGNESSSEDESTSVDAVTGAAVDGSTVLGGPGEVTYGKNTLFTIVSNAPNSSDPNIKCFNNSANGGLSKCISGKPTDKICNVLSNCVGWAAGRFNQIYNILMKTNGQMKYPFACNAENFIEKAREFGLSVGTTPQIGAIMVWQKGNTLGGSDGAGHVAIVERVDSADKVYTSESGWNNSKKMWNKTRTKGTGNWGSSGAYKFRGFIYNPAVSAKLGAGSVTKMSATESKTAIWKYMKNKGLTDYAISGAMGCWQAESGNKADRVEGDYLKSYPGSATVLASRKSISDYTSGKLFNAYANSNISINKNAYKGTDGYYYPGIGLAQWTGPRAEKLINYGEQSGKNFRNLDTQLDFFWSEFQNRSGLKDKMNSATSPQDATTKFLDGFEMYDGWHNTSTGKKQNRERQGYAQSIYNTYAGTGSGAKPVTYDFTNPNNDPFGTGSSVPTVETRRARTVSGSASKLRENEDQLNQILTYIKIIAENTTNNKLLGTLVELQNDTVSLLAKVSSNNANGANNTASEDYAKSIESDIAKMRAKLDSISQTL